jgi:lysozyme family protein
MHDPKQLVDAARANGEPQLAEWLQREVDENRRTRRRDGMIRLATAAAVLAIAALLAIGVTRLAADALGPEPTPAEEPMNP